MDNDKQGGATLTQADKDWIAEFIERVYAPLVRQVAALEGHISAVEDELRQTRHELAEVVQRLPDPSGVTFSMRDYMLHPDLRPDAIEARLQWLEDQKRRAETPIQRAVCAALSRVEQHST